MRECKRAGISRKGAALPDIEDSMPKLHKAPAGMVLIPGGEFTMGVTTDDATAIDPNYPEEDAFASARPQRRIYVDAFFMDIYPVTNAQYQKFIDETEYPVPVAGEFDSEDFPVIWDAARRRYAPGWAHYPVVLVSWYDAFAFCEWAGKRLPTEAEWEKAARGVDARPFPWGWDTALDKYTSAGKGCSDASAGNQPDAADLKRNHHPVGAFPAGASPFGCFDMLGSTKEWCANWHSEKYYRHMPYRNPQGPREPEDAKIHSKRGCGYFSSIIHVSLRDGISPWCRDHYTGFRCARSVHARASMSSWRP